MMHEFKQIVAQALENQRMGIPSVLATVVALEGSSYRRPGVRMLISENGQMTGAVSGGCVEKEVLRQSRSVFESGQAKIMTYDGRYRLGCKGILYILLEPLYLSTEWQQTFDQHLSQRLPLTIASYFIKQDGEQGNWGSVIELENEAIPFSPAFVPQPESEVFSHILTPSHRLILVGAEHDAVKLCKQGALLGWEVEVMCSLSNPKSKVDFPGAQQVLPMTPDLFTDHPIGPDTSVVLMTHNYALDLKYLLAMKTRQPDYLGILGSVNRREQLFDALFEHWSEVDGEFLDCIHSPAGLNIGSVTPEEIALSIVAEILSIQRQKQPFSLKEVRGSIHAK
ncbi:MAG: XdhC family protein [Bacteroidota bacterium]